MQILLKVTERAERSDGTVRIMLADPSYPGGCSVQLTETLDRPYRVGDRYELTLTPLAKIAQPAPRAPRSGERTSLDAIGTAGGKATVETKA